VLWDRLFGSFQEELDEEPVVFGVRKPLASWNPFWANLQVYAYLWFDAKRTRRWRDKLGVWFRRTGWRPADVEMLYPKSKADLARFRKYEPAVPRALRRYIVGQFLVAVIGILWIGTLYAEQGLTAVVIPCLLLWVQLYTLGLLGERKPHALGFELARVNGILPLGVLGMSLASPVLSGDAQTWGAVVLYAATSSVLLAVAAKSGERASLPG
jgi:hypothetical protein